MTWADRLGRSMFVALAVGLGWGIRGDFGHLLGAMYPGACLALGLAYVSRQRSLFLWMPIIAAVSALGIGSGGTMSYGILHGYAQSDTLVNYGYGFLTLFLQGSAWGVFGGAMIGLVLERRPMTTDRVAGAGRQYSGRRVVHVAAGGHLARVRHQSAAQQHLDHVHGVGNCRSSCGWAWNDRRVGFRGALLGYIGFGLGMAGGRLLGNIANVLQTTSLDFTINHWNVMEVSCGLIGGFIYCFGMVHRPYPEPPERENVPLVSIYGIVFVLGVIPLWHRLSRIRVDEKLEEWARQFQSYGYANPTDQADHLLALLNGVCVLGFVGVAVWMVIHFRRWQRLAAFPVLWLSLVMLLFQNLNALYFYYPHRDKQFNMHNVFWVLLGLMALYVIGSSFLQLRPTAATEASEAEPPVPWLRWLASTAVALAAIIVVAGFVNGEHTMKSANTRWPLWSWSDGPFPREAE